MMEYTNKYWNMLMPFIKKSLNKRYGKAYTKALIPKADAEYRDMLNRSDDIGRDNPMASNTYECLVFLAIWKAADGKNFSRRSACDFKRCAVRSDHEGNGHFDQCQ